MPRVSVVIPTYNRAALLRQALLSCASLGEPDLQIIVADDGSTDDTRQVVESFGDSVDYIPMSHCGRPAAVRNHALERARGELIAFLDSDDLFLPAKIALQAAALDRNGEAVFVYSDGLFFRDDPTRPTGRVLDGMPRPSGEAFADLLRGNFLFPATILARRTAIEKAGGFDDSLTVSEDYDLWLRLAADHDLVYAPGEVAAIRRGDDSLSADSGAVRRAALRVLQKIANAHPDLAARYRSALHEGRARNHASIAADDLGHGAFASGCAHAAAALLEAARAPSTTVPAFLAWYRHRASRRAARPRGDS
jgi:glycosyltransferase involved in cell wall biosynthesis